jgi:hypothetical protein
MKNLQLLKKINMFHKFAIEFVQQTPSPNTFAQDMQFIKQTIQSLIQTYQPQIQQNPDLYKIITSLTTYLTTVDQVDKMVQNKQTNTTELLKYMAENTPQIAKIILYFSQLETNRNPTLSQQLYSSYTYLTQTATNNFTQLAQSSESPQSSPQNNDDQTIQQYKTFFQNFKPEQLGRFLNMKGTDFDVKIIWDPNTKIDSLPPQKQPMVKAFQSLPIETQKQFIDAVNDAWTIYRNNKPSPNALNSQQNRTHLQLLMNKLFQSKGLDRYYIPITGNIDDKSLDAITENKVFLELPPSTSVEQLFQKLKQLYPDVKPPTSTQSNTQSKKSTAPSTKSIAQQVKQKAQQTVQNVPIIGKLFK